MSNEDITLDDETLIKYLNLYNADIDWSVPLAKVANKFSNEGREGLEKRAAATILMPVMDRSIQKRDFPPEGLLFGCAKFDTYDEMDWRKNLKKVISQDRATLELRIQALDLGIISPVEYNARSRQAYNWLTSAAEASETTRDCDKAQIRQKMETLVFIYGGAVICNVFDKPEYGKWIKQLMNWRTGYFFERLIHRIYTPEQILKIKRHDIEEIKRTNPELIKRRD